MKKIFDRLFQISIYKTIIVNLRLFPLSDAVKLPVYIYKGVKLHGYARGKIVFTTPISAGTLKIGKHNVGTVDVKYYRSIFENRGTIIVNGNVQIGAGSRISVLKGGVLEFGNNFSITGGSQIICGKNVKFGDGCLLSWDILVMDTDFHKITDLSGKKLLNEPAPVIFGRHVWVGCRATILKGVEIADNTIIASGATVTRDIMEENAIYGGNGKTGGIICRNVRWEL